MCNKPKPNNKRKLNEFDKDNEVRMSCPESDSPFHNCSIKCVQRWGVDGNSNEPPSKRQKIDNNHNHNHNGKDKDLLDRNMDQEFDYDFDDEDEKEHSNDNGGDNDTFDVASDSEDDWKCTLCTVINKRGTLSCNTCGTEKNAKEENVLQRLKSQRDELERNKDNGIRRRRSSIDNILQEIERSEQNDSFDVASDAEEYDANHNRDSPQKQDDHGSGGNMEHQDEEEEDDYETGDSQIESDMDIERWSDNNDNGHNGNQNGNDNKEKANLQSRNPSKEENDSDEEEEADIDLGHNKENVDNGNNGFNENEFSEHESDDDVALEMFKNGLTREVVENKTQSPSQTDNHFNKNKNGNNDNFDIDPGLDLSNSKKNGTSKYDTRNPNKNNYLQNIVDQHDRKKRKSSNHNKRSNAELLFELLSTP